MLDQVETLTNNFMKYTCFTWMFIFFLSVIGKAEISHGIDMDALKKYAVEENQRANQEIREREGIDKPWMFTVLRKVHERRSVSDDELRRVWEVFAAERNHTPEDKLIAFRLIAELEDISKWQKEFDNFAYSKDSPFVKTAIHTLFWKLHQGTEREKITLSNKTAVLEHLVQFAEDNKSDTTIDRETSKLLEITKPYQGKTPPPESQRPDRRYSESPVEATSKPYEKNPGSSRIGSFMQTVGKSGNLTFAAIIGMIVVAILIWRWKSKSTI
jgi:hypothetical protein